MYVLNRICDVQIWCGGGFSVSGFNDRRVPSFGQTEVLVAMNV